MTAAISLPSGSKNLIHHYPEMAVILNHMLSVGDMTTTTDIHNETGISTSHISGHLRRLKLYGIVVNSYKSNCSMAHNWWIVPSIRHNLSSFLSTLEY